MKSFHKLKWEDSEILKEWWHLGPGKSTNHTRAHPIFGDNQTNDINVPLCINDYNYNIGGDIAVEFRSYYDTQLTSFRAWYPSFFGS
jgi:hypothetical protein